MEKTIAIISFVGLGIFVMFNPTFTHRGGTTDLSYVNLNILFGLTLMIFAILLIKKIII